MGRSIELVVALEGTSSPSTVMCLVLSAVSAVAASLTAAGVLVLVLWVSSRS